MTRSALFAVIALGCTRASPSDSTTEPPKEPAKPVVAPVVIDASPPIDAANLVATCGTGWRSVASALSRLDADEHGVTLCSSASWPDMKTTAMKESPPRCARLDLATGVFTEHPPSTPVIAAAAVTVEGTRVCRGSACVALDVPAADAAALAEADATPDLDPQGARAVLVLPVEKTAGVFDTATGKRLRTLAVTTAGARCAANAFFIGDVIYASARGCEDLDVEERRAWIFAGTRKTAITPLPFARAARLPLAGGAWAVASLKPYRVVFFDGSTGAIQWSVPLPGNTYDPMTDTCCLALGVTAYGTLVHDVTPLARVGTSAAIVVVTPRSITRIDPVAKTTKVLPFPPCT